MILLFSERLIIVLKGCKGSFGKISVKKLLIDGGDEINIPDEISRWDSILIDDAFDLFIGKTETEQASSSRETGDEFILDAGALSEFIVILKESFHSDLFFPYFCPKFCLNCLNVDRISK